MQNNNTYWQIEFVTIPRFAELFCSILESLGASSTAKFEQNAERIKVEAIFTEKRKAETAQQFTRQQFPRDLIFSQDLIELSPQDWQKTSIQDFKPMNFGKRLCVHPSWDAPQNNNRENIILDPGLAFGTGTHPTTALCLEWLDENIHGNEIVIDYGCGSGILAMAAIKLGAQKVYAVDIDPEAIIVTKENIKINKLPTDKIEVLLPEKLPEIKADILIANILANPLMNLAPLFKTLIKSRGKIALSGILAEQQTTVKEHYEKWFRINPPQAQDEWVILSDAI
ncbi:MAG: 50S ribosomal protein L11 methyltransferase [Gammaproteobacteria bacterium]|nr:50S ribosomal protein L11 methyltransferase [Gammaproteobacteria bacterium]